MNTSVRVDAVVYEDAQLHVLERELLWRRDPLSAARKRLAELAAPWDKYAPASVPQPSLTSSRRFNPLFVTQLPSWPNGAKPLPTAPCPGSDCPLATAGSEVRNSIPSTCSPTKNLAISEVLNQAGLAIPSQINVPLILRFWKTIFFTIRASS